MKRTYLLLLCLFISSLIIAQENKSNPAPAPYSKARLVNETLYIAGQISRNPETGQLVNGNIKEATEQCMKNIGAILKEFRYGYNDLVMVQIFLMDLDDYNDVNDAYRTFFEDGVYPARVCLQVSKIPGDSEIEISAIAEKKKDAGFDLP